MYLAFEYSNPPHFEVKFKKCSQAPLSWKEEIYKAAVKIAQSTTKTIYLCMSGGIDSEVMCQAFWDQKIPFKGLTLEHKEKTNRHDIRYAIEWCRRHKVEHEIIPFDVKGFLEKEIDSYVDQGYEAGHPYFYFQIRLMEIAEKLGGCAVLGGGEQLYFFNDGRPSLSFESGRMASLAYCQRNNLQHMPYFYLSTPELCLSYNQIPAVKYILNHPELLKPLDNTYLMKRFIYQSIWPDLKPREKYHGYEGVAVMAAYTSARLQANLKDKLQTFYLPADEFESQLTVS